MKAPSKLTACPECGQQLHIRGLASHLAFKHPSMQIPLPMDAGPRRAAVLARRETALTPSGAGIKPKPELSESPKSEIPKSELPEIDFPFRTEKAEKRKGKGGWLLLALLAAALWASRKTPSDAIETLQERHGTHLGHGIGGYKG